MATGDPRLEETSRLAQAVEAVKRQNLDGDPRMRQGDHVPDLRRMGIAPEHWYPLARSSALGPGKLLAVRFAGEPIVLARGESGSVFALEDRCAHRQFPLSQGLLQGDRLQCGYHGWRYDAGGRCVGLPYASAEEGMPRGVRAYPCREAYGFIFVFPGSAELSETVPLPDLPLWEAPTHKTMTFQREIACHYSFLHENLMDMNHQVLHRRIMGRLQASLRDWREEGDRVEVDYAMRTADGSRPWGARLMIRDRRDRSGAEGGKGDILTVGTEYPYQHLSVRVRSGEPAFHLWACYLPLDREQRRSLSVGLLMIRRPNLRWLTPLLWPGIRLFTERVFAEDRAAVEAEQRAHDAQGADWNQEVFPPILALKDLLRRKGVPLEAESPEPA